METASDEGTTVNDYSYLVICANCGAEDYSRGTSRDNAAACRVNSLADECAYCGEREVSEIRALSLDGIVRATALDALADMRNESKPLPTAAAVRASFRGVLEDSPRERVSGWTIDYSGEGV